MMRLPIAPSSNGLDACFVGIPIDHGTSNRSGTRYRKYGTIYYVSVLKVGMLHGLDYFSNIAISLLFTILA